MSYSWNELGFAYVINIPHPTLQFNFIKLYFSLGFHVQQGLTGDTGSCVGVGGG